MEHLYITAIRSGRRLNENWSTLLYGTAGGVGGSGSAGTVL